MSGTAKAATVDEISAPDGGAPANFTQESTVNSTEVDAKTADGLTRSISKGSRKISIQRACLPPPPPLPPPNPPVAPSCVRTKSKRNLPPPPPPPSSANNSELSTLVTIGGAKEIDETVCDDDVDKSTTDQRQLSCTDHVNNKSLSNEKTASCTCALQDQSGKKEKFYSVSARDRNIVSCSLSKRSSSTSNSVIMVNINLDEKVDTLPSASVQTPGADSSKTKQKVLPKPKPRAHRPSAVVSGIGSSGVMASDVTQSQAMCERTVGVEVSLSGQNDRQSVNKPSVMHQRVKPPTPPKKPAIAKLRTKVNGNATDSSDDGLAPQGQDSSPERRPVPPRRTKHKLTQPHQVAAPSVTECNDKMFATGFVTGDEKGHPTGGATNDKKVLKQRHVPKINSFTTEDLDIFQKPNADSCKLDDVMDNDDQQLHQDSPSKGRKPSVKRSKSAGVNFAGKKSALTVKPQIAEKPKVPEKPVKTKPQSVVSPKDEDNSEIETNENANATNAAQVKADVAKTKKKGVIVKPGRIKPENETTKNYSDAAKVKPQSVKVNSITKTTWFVETETKEDIAERAVADDEHHLVERSCSASSMSPTRENTDYENIPDNSHIYGNVEIRRNCAGRNDIVDKVMDREWSPLLDINIPRSDSSNMLETLPSSENIYEDVDVEDDHEFRRRSLKKAHRNSKRSKATGDEEDLAFSDDEDYFDDDSFSDSDEEFDQELLSSRLSQHSQNHDEEGEPISKLEHIARELLSTEISYVNKLYLVDQVFHFHVVAENRECRMFPDEVIPEMFSNIKSIYQFHHDFLLPRLKERMAEWDSIQKIGDVMKQFAPFLKLYTEYVKNFDNAMNVITQWQDKSPKFAELLLSLQKKPECGRLTMQHHMLSPIQRVPRYELLLKDYLKNLPDDSNDREDTKEALHLVQTAANQSNEAMQKIEKFKKLLDINDSLIGTHSIISPTRDLMKEGKIVKITARSGYLLDRYLFLFSDLLLLCQSLPIGIKQHYKVKAKLCLDGMQILEGDNLETPNTFYVKSKEKTLELHASSMEEKTEWQVAMWNVIADYAKKTVSRKPWSSVTDAFSGNDLGKWAPIWIKDQHTTMCMLCSIGFTTFRRRHHCRACGHVVCATCSAHKEVLQYEDNRVNRVCDQCYNVLRGRTGTSINRPVADSSSPRHRGVLQVKGTDPSLLCGFLHMSSDKKTWQKRYYAVHRDFVLYSFKACQDVVAMTSTPLPGYLVATATEIDGITRDNVFKLFHSGMKKVYFFQAEDKGHLMRWLSVLENVVQALLPVVATPSQTKVLPESSA